MKRSILRACALCLSTAFVAGTACAQDLNKPSSSQSRTDSSTLTSQGGPGALSGAHASATMRGQPARLSKLMNTSLRGQTGESLGQVQDLVIDPANGQIQFVVLSLDGTGASATGTPTTTDSSVSSPRTSPSGVGSYGTATGGRLVAIPWRLISSTGSDQYTATVDRSFSSTISTPASFFTCAK